MIVIEEWETNHPSWNELSELVNQLHQTAWVNFTAEWHQSSHMLVALTAGRASGFLRYVIQAIGAEENQPPFTHNGEILLEAKVIAFGVAADQRKQGVGRALQERLIHICQSNRIYQVRSHSSAQNVENHRLKVTLGFAILPIIADERKDGFYFILPLRGVERVGPFRDDG